MKSKKKAGFGCGHRDHRRPELNVGRSYYNLHVLAVIRYIGLEDTTLVSRSYLS
jgi:hypothetical protein